MQPLVSQMGLAERQVMQLPSWMARRVCKRHRVFSFRYINKIIKNIHTTISKSREKSSLFLFVNSIHL
jgi:hypothetical protein